jgi:Zn-dependent protease
VAGIDLYYICRFGADINSFLAVAHLLPFYPLDGYKILRWNTSMWGICLILAGLTFLLV